MKVFLTWSGTVSHNVALAFKDFLPLVIQSVQPFVSSEDIRKGGRWSPDLEKALADSRFGILCLTEDNLAAPWINFEAGALSKTVENSQVNVCPFLFNLKQSAVGPPLAQFQSSRNDRDEILRLVSDVNTANPNEKERVPAKVLEKSFDAFWPEFEKKLAQTAEATTAIPARKKGTGEMLDTVRSQSRLTASREDLYEVVEWMAKRFTENEQRQNWQTLGMPIAGYTIQGIPASGVHASNAFAGYARPYGLTVKEAPEAPQTEPDEEPMQGPTENSDDSSGDKK
jgi:hypothetical protein